ncbi:ATP synthase F0 subcomplex A subunit [Caloramator fervidus]|uniref:ATP synthase subunit a n=1 Tax=Caloramator fervidus TaxID=29344 RepID=A0A1H5RKZ6_9CLOT|nr:F0F1 ATP synthase subunit A [Caloramator fervidus]SEF39023.1 ATP synthase F0 subcomplex A subunit [Caloramator fervidus]
MENAKPLFEIVLFGIKIPIHEVIVLQWIIMLFIISFVLVLFKKLRTVPNNLQSFGEIVVETINNLVLENMGKKYIKFAPFIGTLAIFLTFMNLFDLFGFRPPTSDYSVALGLAIMSFVLIQANAIKENGLKHYFKAFAKPFSFMLPLNIIERLVVPISLSLRLFGNVLAAVIIVELLYKALGYVTKILNISIPILQIGLPIPFHIYFSIFDGLIQMLIFIMLTMIFIKTTSEH